MDDDEGEDERKPSEVQKHKEHGVRRAREAAVDRGKRRASPECRFLGTRRTTNDGEDGRETRAVRPSGSKQEGLHVLEWDGQQEMGERNNGTAIKRP